MAYQPIAKYVPNWGSSYSGYVLKAYAAGTSTNISMATDTTGSSTATSIALNAAGQPAINGSIVIPHIDQDYKLALYPTQAAADSNTGATWTIDNIPITDNGTIFAATETGTGDAYEILATTTPAAYTAGEELFFIASEANVGACTLNKNSLGAKSIKLLDGSDPYNNAIVANMIVHVIYDGTNFQLQNPSLNEAILLETKGSDIASATTTDIGAATGNFVDVTGTTTITGLGTVKEGTKRTVQFDGALTLTYNATSLILPGNADISVKAGDVAEFISLGSGNWMMTNYLSESTIPLIETGTWVPTIQDLSYSDGEGQTYTTQEGNYIKIGKTVFITGYLKISSLGTLSIRVILAGLPFTASSTPSSFAGTIHIGYGQALSVTAGQSMTCAVDKGTTRATLWLWESTTGSTAMSPTQLTGLGELAFSGQYLID